MVVLSKLTFLRMAETISPLMDFTCVKKSITEGYTIMEIVGGRNVILGVFSSWR